MHERPGSELASFERRVDGLRQPACCSRNSLNLILSQHAVSTTLTSRFISTIFALTSSGFKIGSWYGFSSASFFTVSFFHTCTRRTLRHYRKPYLIGRNANNQLTTVELMRAARVFISMGVYIWVSSGRARTAFRK